MPAVMKVRVPPDVIVHTPVVEDEKLIGREEVEYAVKVMQSQNSITAAFTGAPNATFTTLGLDPAPWVASGGLGFAQKTADGMEVSTRYDIAFNNGSVSQTASLNLRLDF